MIGWAIAVIAIGLVAGAAMDALLRGRDPQSMLTVGAGVVGAIAGVSVRYAFWSDEALARMLCALVGAMVVAFATRVRISAAEARRHRRIAGTGV